MCTDGKMMVYCLEIKKLKDKFHGLEYIHVLRGKNEIADELPKLGSSRSVVPSGVFLHVLHEPTIRKKVDGKADLSKEDLAILEDMSQKTDYVGKGSSINDEMPSTPDAGIMIIDLDWRSH